MSKTQTRSRNAPRYAYEVLGVTPSDDFVTIRNAWRKLARDNHPDVAGGDIEEATRRFAEINDAYDQLRNHRKRPEKPEAERAADEALRARLRRREAALRRAQEEADRLARLEREAAARAYEAARKARRDAARAAARENALTVKPSLGTIEALRLAAAQRGYETLVALGLRDEKRKIDFSA